MTLTPILKPNHGPHDLGFTLQAYGCSEPIHLGTQSLGRARPRSVFTVCFRGFDGPLSAGTIAAWGRVLDRHRQHPASLRHSTAETTYQKAVVRGRDIFLGSEASTWVGIVEGSSARRTARLKRNTTAPRELLRARVRRTP
jgi:hypothetical protein